jgi:hypothetical protein
MDVRLASRSGHIQPMALVLRLAQDEADEGSFEAISLENPTIETNVSHGQNLDFRRCSMTERYL